MNAPSIVNFLNSWALIFKIDTKGEKLLVNAYRKCVQNMDCIYTLPRTLG